jgi:stage V sporulation protein K
MNDKEHGKGISYYNEGDKYEGDWADGKITGAGTFYYKDGDKYEGEFLNG